MPRKRSRHAFAGRVARDSLNKQVRRHFSNAHLYAGAFTGINRIYKAVNETREARGQNRVTVKQVKHELSTIPAYVLYTAKHRVRHTLPTLSPSLNFYWQIDLLSMQSIADTSGDTSPSIDDRRRSTTVVGHGATRSHDNTPIGEM